MHLFREQLNTSSLVNKSPINAVIISILLLNIKINNKFEKERKDIQSGIKMESLTKKAFKLRPWKERYEVSNIKPEILLKTLDFAKDQFLICARV